MHEIGANMTTSHIASAVHAYILIAFGVWDYYAGGSMTAFIPVIFGVVILVMNNGVRYLDKAHTRIAIGATVLAIGVCIKPLLTQLSEGNTLGIFRIGAMLLSGVWALILFVRNLTLK